MIIYKTMRISVEKKQTKSYKEITVKRPQVRDFIEAKRITGSDDEFENACALASVLCSFDGDRLTFEDIKLLPMSDFLQLQNALNGVLK